MNIIVIIIEIYNLFIRDNFANVPYSHQIAKQN